MAISRMYTPQALADATGLCLSQCRTLIAQSENKICVSRNPNSQKKRWVIGEQDFQKLLDQLKRKGAAAMRQQQEQNPEPERRRGRKPQIFLEEGLNPDGTIMNSRQLKAAGLWEGR